MNIVDATITFQAYLEGARSGQFVNFVGEEDDDFAEDLKKAKAAMETAWMEMFA